MRTLWIACGLIAVLGEQSAGQVPADIAERRRSAMAAYSEGRYAAALEIVETSPEQELDEKLRLVGAWCLLRLAASDGSKLDRAAKWFAEMRAGRDLRDLPSQVVLGIGRCEQQRAEALPAAGRSVALRLADAAFAVLIEREEHLVEALRYRCDVRLALGDGDGAADDARALGRHVAELCEEMEAMLANTRIEGYRRELTSRLAERRREVDGVRAALALHRWRDGDQAAARREAQAFLSRETPPFDQSAVAELLVLVMPEDPRIAPAYAHRLGHGSEATERRDAAVALGRFGEQSRGAVPALIEATADPAPIVAREAVTALGMIGPGAADAIPVLEKLVEHDDPQMRMRAASALRQIERRRPSSSPAR